MSRLSLLLLIASLTTISGCFSKPLVVEQSSHDLHCAPVLSEPCEALSVPVSTDLRLLPALMIDWGQLYKICSEKQQQLAALTLHQNYLVQLKSQEKLVARCNELFALAAATRDENQSLSRAVAETEEKITAQREQIDTLAQQATSNKLALDRDQSALDALKDATIKAKLAAAELSDPELDATIASLEAKQVALSQQLTARS